MLCKSCQRFCKEAASQIQILHPDNGEAPAQWGHYSTVLHRNLGELKVASDQRCPICRAIYFTPTQHEKSQLSANCIILLEMDPQDGTHPVLSAIFQDEKGSALISKRTVAAYAGLMTDDELARTLSKCADAENNNTGSEPAFQLASFWLKRCLETHEACSKSKSTPPFMPSRVLDVSGGTVRLVETRKEAIAEKGYVALSHCWGKTQIITTKTGTLADRLKRIDYGDLSKTFQDAVEVTRKLSYRYLWIDSLCIIQDDSADWEKEAAQMCNVYQNAVFTIAAAHAPGGHAGCFKERDGTLQFPFILDFPVTGDQGKPLRALFSSYGRSDGLVDPETPLFGRAWVMQEQILSPRALIFDAAQMRWECLCAHGSERSPQGGGGASRGIGYHRWLRDGINDARGFFAVAELPDPDARFQHYKYCAAVTAYTHRGMTQASDRLVAIAGIADAVRAKTSNQYLAGLWRDQLWLGLLWSIPHQYMEKNMLAFDVEANAKIRHDVPVAPSWSWASVTAPVAYPVPDISTAFIQRVCVVEDAAVQGRSPARQTGTLRIRGHVRRGYVNSVYQYAIREAAEKCPQMQFCNPDGGAGGKAVEEETMTHCGRSFHPREFFLWSGARARCRSDWQLMRGEWRPDEVLDPAAEITFVAVAQIHRGASISTVKEADPLKVFALGLVPTGNAPGEYRRVGYAAWDDCAWYGHFCGEGYKYARGCRHGASWPFWRAVQRVRRTPPAVVKVGDGVHQHQSNGSGADGLPDDRLYGNLAKVGTETLVIV